MSGVDERRDAVPLAPERMGAGGPPDPLARKHGSIGAAVSRFDGPLKVKGSARFAAEFVMDRMVYAAFVFSTIAKGRITHLDTSAAEAAPGVVLVMTHKNAPPLKSMSVFYSAEMEAAAPSSLLVMQDDRIHWNGQPVAVVLAETQEQADSACSLVQVGYESEPVPTFAEAKLRGYVPETVNFEPAEIEIGDAEAALERAETSVDLRFTTPRHSHNPIEPHAVTLAWRGGELFIHDAQQGVAQAAWTIAQAFDVDATNVHISSPYVGGGFGSKCVNFHHVLAAAASRLVDRPVRATLSRVGVNRLVGGRTNTEQRVAIGADGDGRFTSIIHSGVCAITSHNVMAESFNFPTRHLYQSETFKFSQELAEMDMVANGFMRGPGEAVGSFALECAVDELAEALGLDPIELRIRNEPATDPTSGLAYSSRNLVEACRVGAERFRWADRKGREGARTEGEWLIGAGFAVASYPYIRWPGGGARLTINKVGHATIEVPAADMGMGTLTAQTVVSAERLGLSPEKVTVTYGESSFPGLIFAAGSSQTATIGAAVISAQHRLVEELLQMAGSDSPLFGLQAHEISCRDGGLCKTDEPERHQTYASLLRDAQRDEVTVVGKASDPDEMWSWSMHSFGALFCEAQVSTVTGETRITEFLGVFDCGRILNSKLAASQFRGGIIMGLGLALMEETEVDERFGRIMNPGLAGYHFPAHLDVPDIDVAWLDVPDPHTPMGARGVGEIGITGVGAAVANAVYSATGLRVRDLPITPDKTLVSSTS